MILKSLLKIIIQYVNKHPDEHGSRFLLECAKSTDKTIEQYMMSLPAYAIIQVRDYVPNAFPRNIRKGPIEVKRNSLGAWRVDPVEVSK